MLLVNGRRGSSGCRVHYPRFLLLEGPGAPGASSSFSDGKSCSNSSSSSLPSEISSAGSSSDSALVEHIRLCRFRLASFARGSAHSSQTTWPSCLGRRFFAPDSAVVASRFYTQLRVSYVIPWNKRLTAGCLVWATAFECGSLGNGLGYKNVSLSSGCVLMRNLPNQPHPL